MASNTPNLDLLKKDPVTDGNDTFNIETMLNENWDKIDAAVGQLEEEMQEIDIPLSDETNGTRSNVAGSEKAVGLVMQAANAANLAAGAVRTEVDTHVNLTTAHGAVSTATANRMIVRDASGRAKVAAPSASDDIAIKSTVDNAVGTLSTLKTTAKTNAVAAINELFQSASDGKTAVAAAITGKGVPASGSDTFAQLAGKIEQIVTGKRYATGTATSLTIQQNYYYYENGSLNRFYALPISGLDFVPSFIFCTYKNNTSHPTSVFYTANSLSTYYPNARLSLQRYLGGTPSPVSIVLNSEVLSGPDYILPVINANKQYNWFAIG